MLHAAHLQRLCSQLPSIIHGRFLRTNAAVVNSLPFLAFSLSATNAVVINKSFLIQLAR